MNEDDFPLDFAVQIKILQDGKLAQSGRAVRRSELRFCFELTTGIGWLDLWRYYDALRETGEPRLSVPERVCHSYEKWGDWQQEVLEVKVNMQRVVEHD
ncbi:hypothetical protein [Ferriphaselus sp. R-1]|uniref:hypothetical protein n=1 Tax=Ferriphaselus sp. R-1 TaxID=1485544 RepID=UPI00055176AC|nr:hypothetical protein [Ferriphaselus sp. R-1]